MRVVWSPLAELRASEAVDAIAKDRPHAAAVWLEKLLARVETLDRFATQGRAVPEIGRPAYRQLLHRPYRIIYRIDAKQIVILTLRHERRAWDAAEIPPDG
ncbi:MAG: type II toxin-antitoxin system RelE/ParE family toxin [Gemmatimonadetes bacterium]|nr:type II toxin-antitoxin system RelE/ParE family toxin [Gemmatimonadota bacterium]